LTPTGGMAIHNLSTTMSSLAGVRRSYAPIPTPTSNVILNSNTRKPRSYLASATSIMKTPMYPSGRYMSSTANNNNYGTALTISDSDNRDPITSAILKAASNQPYRGKSPMASTAPLPTHSYYTRSKSV
jgi:hypothetical protein